MVVEQEAHWSRCSPEKQFIAMNKLNKTIINAAAYWSLYYK